MLRLFKPDHYIENFQQFNLERLKEKGIKLLICDIDNTLVAHDEPYPTKEVVSFVKKVRSMNIEFVLISNNTIERSEKFAKHLEVDFYGFAKKPLKTTYKKILNDYNVSVHELASLGDQLLTDVLGSRRMKIDTTLTKPLYASDNGYTKINRRIENLIYRLLARRNYLIRGVYDE